MTAHSALVARRDRADQGGRQDQPGSVPPSRSVRCSSGSGPPITSRSVTTASSHISPVHDALRGAYWQGALRSHDAPAKTAYRLRSPKPWRWPDSGHTTPEKKAIRTLAGTIGDLRAAEVAEHEIHLDEGGAITCRTKLQLSFKHEREH